MIIVFISVGSFIIGACLYGFWRASFKRVYVSFFKTKQIQECKERLRELNFSGVPINKRVETYISDKKIQLFAPEIITEAERLYFKQKQFDDLVEYISNFEFSFSEVFFKKFKIFTKLNKNHKIVKTLIEHNWKDKIIIRAFKTIQKGLKSKNIYKQTTSLPINHVQSTTPEIKPERVKSDIDAPSELNLLQGVVEGQSPENIQSKRRYFK